MKQSINIMLCLLPILICMSCISHGDGKIHERNIALKLITDLDQLGVFIKPEGQEIKVPIKSGVYYFQTPELRFHTPFIFGIELRDNIWDISDFLIIKQGSKVVYVLSCEEIWNLEKDQNGYSYLKLNR